VENILAYSETIGESAPLAAAVADRFDAGAGNFARTADSLRLHLPEYDWSCAYQGETHASDTDARLAFSQALTDGAELALFVGHGSASHWGRDRIVAKTDLTWWTGNAVLIQATCNGNYFVWHPQSYQSLVTKLLTRPGGGTPASIGATTYCGGEPHAEFMAEVLRASRSCERWGDALLQAQQWAWQRSGGKPGMWHDFVIAECLLGDPALPIK
jgi:hypothetical protein